MNDTWAVFLDINFTPVLKMTTADKKFLQLAAQKGVLAAAEVSPLPAVSTALIKYSSSKSIPLAEFSIRSLEVLVKNASPALYHE